MESYSPNLLADSSFTKMLADFFSQFFFFVVKILNLHFADENLSFFIQLNLNFCRD